jgi:diacylglycerol kinase family enzyme
MVNSGKAAGNCVLLFGNPRAGATSRTREIDAFAEALRDRKYQIEIITNPDDLGETAARAQQRGDLRMVVAAGGDGTVRLVVSRTPPEVPIMVLPMGTENLLAKYLQISHDLRQWCDIVDGGTWLRWDAGRVVAGGEHHKFLLMFSCGFDADVVRRLHEERSGNIRHLSYAKPILDSIRSYDYPELRLEYLLENSDEWTEHRAHWAFAFNIPAYAGGLRITPLADPADGLFDLCTFVGGSFPSGLFHLATVMLRQQGKWSNFSHIRARRIRVSAEQEVPYQIDGDPGGVLPVEIEIVSGSVTMMVPANWRAELPMA